MSISIPIISSMFHYLRNHQLCPFVCESGWSDTVDSFAVKPKLTAPGKLYFLARVRANTCNFIFKKEEYFSPETKLTALTRELERARKPDFFLLLREYFPRGP